jgi:hypothetical protein
MERFGKLIIFIGFVVVVIGIVVWMMGDKLRFPGRLPGDIRIERENVRIFIPITTMLLISLLLSLIFWLFNKIGK